MKHQKTLILFIAISLFFSFTAHASFQAEALEMIANLNRQIQELQQRIKSLVPSNKTALEISAEYYMAINITDNSVILEKNSNTPHSIASITKLMNSVVAVENIDLNKTITLDKEMLKPIGYSPSLFLGLNVSAQNLLKASLIQSTNDAAQSLTCFLKEGEFIDLMNKKAKELGMANTFYCDPHGLNPQNVSTASDLIKLLSFVYKNHPEILTITKDDNFWLPNTAGRLLKFANLNFFYNFPEFVGGKSGYLPEAKHTFASLFNINGKTYAIAVLYSKNSKADTSKIVDWIKNQ